MKLADIIGDYHYFLDSIHLLLLDYAIPFDKYEIDHICFRVSSVEEYRLKQRELKKLGKLLQEEVVNGRKISTFELYKSIKYKDKKIKLLELPAPKMGRIYPSGLEHIEFNIDTTLEDFQERYPKVDFDKNGLNKKENRFIRIDISNDFKVKFREKSLKDYIER